MACVMSRVSSVGGCILYGAATQTKCQTKLDRKLREKREPDLSSEKVLKGLTHRAKVWQG